MARQIKESERFLIDGLVDSSNLIETVLGWHSEDGLKKLEVLDFGCGQGRMFRYLRHILPRLSGYDLSPDMIQRCQYYESDLGVLTSDLDIFKDGRFDVVYSYQVICHIDRFVVPKVIREIHRLLKPGGYAFIQIPLDEKTSEETTDYRRIRRYSIYDLRILLSPFEIVKVAEVSREYHVLQKPS